MLRSLRTFVALVVFALVARAQAPDAERIQELNQKAVEALTAKRYDDGIGLLKQVLDLLQEDKGTAYNLACAHAMKGDVDGGFGWMEKACGWGWGEGAGSLATDLRTRLTEVQMLKTDPDLENLRKDARWAPLVAKVEANVQRHDARVAKGRAYAAAPAIYVPEAIRALEKKPVLLVVHDEGSTKDQVVAGIWKDVADALGYALVAPSGRFPIGEEPAEKGMAWFEKTNDYIGNDRGAADVESAVHAALKAFEKTDKLDRSKLVLVGEGQTGTLVAFGAGVSSAGLYKAVLGVDGVFEPARLRAKGANAAKLGQRAALVLEATAFGEDAKKNEQVLAQVAKLLAEAGLGNATGYTKQADPKARAAFLVEQVKALLASVPPPTPAPAAPAPK